MRSFTIVFCSLIVLWAGFPFQAQAQQYEKVWTCYTRLENSGDNTFIIDNPDNGGAPDPYNHNQLLPHGKLAIEYVMDDRGGMDPTDMRLYILEADGKYRDLGPVNLTFTNVYCENAYAEHENWHNYEIISKPFYPSDNINVGKN